MKLKLSTFLVVSPLLVYASINKGMDPPEVEVRNDKPEIKAPAEPLQKEKDDEKAKQKEKFKDFLKALLSGFGKDDEGDKKGSSMPRSAMEYVKMCEPELGVPPKINLSECIEIPIYVNGVQKHGALRSKELDNPNLQGKGFTSSGSGLQRYEGRTAEGKPLPDVIWIAFGRNEDWDGDQRRFVGSVQMIG